MRHLTKFLCCCLGLPLLMACDPEVRDATVTGKGDASVYADRLDKQPDSLRVATFNVSMYRQAEGQLLEVLLSEDKDPQLEAVAKIIRDVDPDILILNEIDYHNEWQTLGVFKDKYLTDDSVDGIKPESYPYLYMPATNTGMHSGVDFDNNGKINPTPGSREYGGDSFGFGTYPGQYGMAILSKKKLYTPYIRSYQNMLWQDMPDNMMPTDYYSNEAQQVFRLSSKNHIAVPAIWNQNLLYLIVAHPTPPSFDGPENRNGRRNHDEIRLISDMITAGDGDYLVDDNGVEGPLEDKYRFVIFGDLNADPTEGDKLEEQAAIDHLLKNPLVQDPMPKSKGAVEAARLQGGANKDHQTIAEDTADFRDEGDYAIGNLRLDYVLPSKRGIEIVNSGVYWPETTDANYDLIGDGHPVISSDHRLVWVDLKFVEMDTDHQKDKAREVPAYLKAK